MTVFIRRDVVCILNIYFFYLSRNKIHGKKDGWVDGKMVAMVRISVQLALFI